MEKFVDFRQQGRTLVLVTHDATTVRNFCDRAIWLDHGSIRMVGDPADVVDQYTEAMLGAETSDGAEVGRRGDGKLTIDTVELIVSGVPVDRFHTGDDLTVRLHFTAHEPVDKPVFEISIASLGGATVSAPSSRQADKTPARVSGSGSVDILLENVPLIAQRYVLHTEVTGYGRQHVYDHLQNARTFDVVTGTSRETSGLVTLHPQWTITGDGVETE
jgi:ABC-2 type transport system ATP-binding protein